MRPKVIHADLVRRRRRRTWFVALVTKWHRLLSRRYHADVDTPGRNRRPRMSLNGIEAKQIGGRFEINSRVIVCRCIYTVRICASSKYVIVQFWLVIVTRSRLPLAARSSWLFTYSGHTNEMMCPFLFPFGWMWFRDGSTVTPSHQNISHGPTRHATNLFCCFPFTCVF